MIKFGNYQYLIYICIITGLVLAIFIFYLIWKKLKQRKIFKDKNMQKLLLQQNKGVAITKYIILCLAILLCGFTLLRPQWGDKIREANQEGTDLVIALDVSRSMLAEDVSPNRLKRAKEAIELLLDAQKGCRVGLVLFAGDAFLQCPLTSDVGAFKMFLDSASPESVRIQGTDLGKALDVSKHVFETKRLTTRMLVLITDGEDHEANYKQAAEDFKKMGVSVFAIGIGKERGEYIPLNSQSGNQAYLRDKQGNFIRTKKDTSLLKWLAQETGGDYGDITKNLSGIYKVKKVLAKQEKQNFGSHIVKEKKEQYFLFAYILIVLLLLELFLPDRLDKASFEELELKRKKRKLKRQEKNDKKKLKKETKVEAAKKEA